MREEVVLAFRRELYRNAPPRLEDKYVLNAVTMCFRKTYYFRPATKA